MERDFKVVRKGVEGKDEDPFVVLKSAAGDMLKLVLEIRSQLDAFEIGDEITVKIGAGEQQKLPGATQ